MEEDDGYSLSNVVLLHFRIIRWEAQTSREGECEMLALAHATRRKEEDDGKQATAKYIASASVVHFRNTYHYITTTNHYIVNLFGIGRPSQRKRFVNPTTYCTHITIPFIWAGTHLHFDWPTSS